MQGCLERTAGPAPALGCPGIRRGDTNKALVASPPGGTGGGGLQGGPAEHLHSLGSLQVQVAGWDWLQRLRPSHPRCALASRLAASRASVLARFLQREPGVGRPAAGAAALQMGAAAGIRGGGGGELRIGARAGARGASAAKCAREGGRRAPQCVRECGRRARLCRGARV